MIETEVEAKNEREEQLEEKAQDQIGEQEEENKEGPEQVKEPEEDFKSKYYYLAAEMDNMRKRFEREKCNLIKYGNEKILCGLIEVVDNFDHTLDALGKEQDEKMKKIVSGIEMIRGQFLDVLAQNGLTPVKALGEIFDPNFHEALSQQTVEGKKEQEIIMEYQKGYVLNGRLLRAAKVVIAKNNE